MARRGAQQSKVNSESHSGRARVFVGVMYIRRVFYSHASGRRDCRPWYRDRLCARGGRVGDRRPRRAV